MENQSKINKVFRILKQNGWSGLFTYIYHYVKFKYGSKAPDEIEIAYKTLNATKLSGIMFDVGAHIGGALALFANASWQVYAFEPDSQNRAKLVEKFGVYKNVNIDDRAVSDQIQQEVILFRSDQSSGLSTLSSFHASHAEGEGVSVITLSSFLEEQDILSKEIDFIKIDVEGFDFNVLKGIPWETTTPRLILCEFEDLKTKPLGYTLHDMASYLQERGYKLIVSEWYPIKRYGGPHDWRRFEIYPCKLADEKAWGNLFAARDSDVYEALLENCGLK